jgi:hypothetical protein
MTKYLLVCLCLCFNLANSVHINLNLKDKLIIEDDPAYRDLFNDNRYIIPILSRKSLCLSEGMHYLSKKDISGYLSEVLPEFDISISGEGIYIYKQKMILSQPENSAINQEIENEAEEYTENHTKTYYLFNKKYKNYDLIPANTPVSVYYQKNKLNITLKGYLISPYSHGRQLIIKLPSTDNSIRRKPNIEDIVYF